MADVSEIRAKARAHQEELSESSGEVWATPQQLANRWHISVTTVKDTPADELPYKEFGNGLKLKRRRYRWSDVRAYEERGVRSTHPASASAA